MIPLHPIASNNDRVVAFASNNPPSCDYPLVSLPILIEPSPFAVLITHLSNLTSRSFDHSFLAHTLSLYSTITLPPRGGSNSIAKYGKISKYCNKYCKISKYCNTYCKFFKYCKKYCKNFQVLQIVLQNMKVLKNFCAILYSILIGNNYFYIIYLNFIYLHFFVIDSL